MVAQLTNSICRSSSLGGQRIVYPTQASSILVYGASFRMITANFFLQPYLQAGPLGGVSWVRVPA